MNSDDSTVSVSAQPGVCRESPLDPDLDKEPVGFVATYSELIILVKQTYLEYLDVGWGGFLTGCTAWDLDLKILSRLGKMAALLPEEVYNRMIAETFAEFGKQVDSTLWDVYLHEDGIDQMAVWIATDTNQNRKRRLGMKAFLSLVRKLAKRERGKSGTST